DAQALLGSSIGYLCHSASVNRRINFGVSVLQSLLGARLKALFGPQHGMVTDVQDNMIESDHFEHPYFKLPVYSLYSETRVPKPEMLKGLDTLIVDLQDVGTRVYTYIHTLSHVMQACAAQAVKVVILDRPNPVGGEVVEGNVLDPSFASFVGLHAIPMRHALTMAEMGLLLHQTFGVGERPAVVKMQGWQRDMHFAETGLPWVAPSPNMPSVATPLPFVGNVLLEGTLLSEGRGTTQPFELFGHPEIQTFNWISDITKALERAGVTGFVLRPCQFMPTFQKHAGVSCRGYQLHIVDRSAFRAWRFTQVLFRELYKRLGASFEWRSPPYEYEEEKLPIDILNGSDQLRIWVERFGTDSELTSLEERGLKDFLEAREDALLYPG
ncbi:MAG: DUF1343 domain-containing protein, partial [Bdellovibrionales bacterium]|nr:DUF1343 domain-containing protein [Bdellovibrionales bacterium]